MILTPDQEEAHEIYDWLDNHPTPPHLHLMHLTAAFLQQQDIPFQWYEKHYSFDGPQHSSGAGVYYLIEVDHLFFHVSALWQNTANIFDSSLGDISHLVGYRFKILEESERPTAFPFEDVMFHEGDKYWVEYQKEKLDQKTTQVIKASKIGRL